MRQLIMILLAETAMLALVASADAQVYHSNHHSNSTWHGAMWDRVRLDWHRNNAFPEPFRYADRHLVRTTWIPYVVKGWQIENTLSDWHFNQENGALTAAGQEKVRWIATQAPPQRRTIFVSEGPDREVTQTRIDLVQQAVTQVLPLGPLPAVVRTDHRPRPASGYQLNEIWKKGEAAIPAPILQSSSGASGGSQ